MKEFIEMSKYAGMREDLVQAGGGNSSVKLDKQTMIIKASGFQLADITEEDGYAIVDPEVVVDFFGDNKMEEIKEEQEQEILTIAFVSGKKPSIETFLHAITDKYTLHTHPTLVNILTARSNGFDILQQLFPDALLVPYATPGINLAKEYFMAHRKSKLLENQIFDIVFLKNHGLIVSGKRGSDVIAKTEEVIEKIADYLKIDIIHNQKVTQIYNLMKKVDPNFSDIVVMSNNKTIQEYVRFEYAGRWDYSFCPDCVVYCGKQVLVLNDCEDIKVVQNHIEQYGKPVVVLWNQNTYIIAQSIKKVKEIECVLAFSAEVIMYNKGHEIDLLSEREKDFLLNWDSEKYRKNMK